MYLCCLALDVRLSMLFVYLHVYEKVVRAFTIYGACLDDLKMTVRPELVSRTLFPSQVCALCQWDPVSTLKEIVVKIACPD
jgi:hypothetical protein